MIKLDRGPNYKVKTRKKLKEFTRAKMRTKSESRQTLQLSVIWLRIPKRNLRDWNVSHLKREELIGQIAPDVKTY